MSDRFDLEQQIMRCWDVVEDLKTLAQYLPSMSSEEQQIIIKGMAETYQMHFTKTFDIFEECIREL